MTDIVYRILKTIEPKAVPEKFEDFNSKVKFSELNIDPSKYDDIEIAVSKEIGRRCFITTYLKDRTPEILDQFIGYAKYINDNLQKKLDSPKYMIPVAVIGMGIRLPGGINTPGKYWNALVNGKDCISPTPTNRHLHQFLRPKCPYNELGPHDHYIHRAGYYDVTPDTVPISEFDPTFFNISPLEAKATEPKFRWVYETVYEAFQDACIDVSDLNGSRTAVYVTVGTTTDYIGLSRAFGATETMASQTIHGSAPSSCAGRIAFNYGFIGPADTIDTACSSGLNDVNNACKALSIGDADLAVVSAVHYQFIPTQFHVLSVAHMASQIGRCATFDAEADGYTPGEGCISLILKRLDDAVTDHDRIYGVISGISTSQSGIRPSISSPAVEPQVQNIHKALNIANLRPEDVDYVEAHGTGTPLGDAIETQTLNLAFGGSHDDKKPLIVGSVKTNIGHTEEVSGLAGLCKVVLSMSHRIIPPHLHLNNLNPQIDLSVIPMTIPTKKCIWKSPRGKKRVGVVSSFGLQGGVANAVVEEFKPPKNDDIRLDSGYDHSMYHILTISGKNKNALYKQIEEYIKIFEAMHEEESVADICYSSNIGRQHFAYRYAVYGRDAGEFIDSLNEILQHKNSIRRYLPKSAAFAFTGQGVAKIGMGKHFYETQPVFRKAMDRCDEVTRRLLNVSIVEVLYNVSNAPNGFEEGEKALKKSSVAQPALFAYEYAMSQLWISWGVVPTMVLGHSLGEIVATTIAGGIDFELAMEFIVQRASCMEKYGIKPGTMVSVFTTEDIVRETINDFGFKNVSVAAINGTTQIVISGNTGEVKELEEHFVQQEIKAKQLNVTEAFHSALMDPAIEKLYEWINSKPDEKFRQPLKYGLISNVTGELVPAGERLPKNYWGEHARNAVQFVKAVETLLANSETLLSVIEVGPANVLTNMSSRILREKKIDMYATPFFVASATPRTDDEEGLFETIAKVYNIGMNIDWKTFHVREDIRNHICPILKKVSIPLYPFQRSRYWNGPDTSKYDIPFDLGIDKSELEASMKKCGYVIDNNKEDAETEDTMDLSDNTQSWSRYETPTIIDLDHLEGKPMAKTFAETNCIISVPLTSQYIHYLRKSHVIGSIGYSPATSYIDFVFYALKYVYPNEQFKIDEYFITNGPLLLTVDNDVVYIMVKKGEEITLYSQSRNGQQEIRGSVMVSVVNDINSEVATAKLGFDIKKDYVEKYLTETSSPSTGFGKGDELYKEMDKNIVYGSFFRSVQSFYSGKEQDGTEFLVSHIKRDISGKEQSIAESGAAAVGILDACIHCMSGDGIIAKKNASGNEVSSNDSFLPTTFEGIIQYKNIPNDVYVLHRVKNVNDTSKSTQYWVFDTDGKLVFSTENFQVKKFDLSQMAQHNEFEFWHIDWVEYPVKPVVNEDVYVIVIKDKKGYADAFMKALKDRNVTENIIGIDLPLKDNSNTTFVHSYREIKAKRTAEGILALYNFSLLDIEDYTLKETDEELESKYKDVYIQCLDTTQAFLRTTGEMNLKKTIGFISMGASDINSPESKVGPFAALAIGVIKGANHEFLDTHGFTFDLEVGTPVDVAANYCVDELLGGVDRYEVPFNVAYRNGKRMTASLGVDKSYERIQFDGLTGNLLITGGLGGVSIDVVCHMLRNEKNKLEHIFLLGRSDKISSSVINKLTHIEEVKKESGKNVDIQYFVCDISNENSVREVFNDIRKRQGLKIDGIFHTAGTNSDTVFLNQTYGKLAELASAKIIGTHNIIKVTDDFKDEVRYIILTSSLSALSSLYGQTNYAAANMFIDAIARYCRNHGRKNVISVELGGWAGAGSAGVLKTNVMTLTSEAGSNMFELLFNVGTQLKDSNYGGVPNVNHENCDEAVFHDYLYRSFRPKNRPRTDLTQLTHLAAGGETEIKISNEDLSPNEILRKEIRRMLMYNEHDELDEMQPLSELGMDSIMMMEFRQIIKAVTKIMVPLSVITAPNLSLTQIFNFISEKTGDSTIASGPKNNDDDSNENNKKKKKESVLAKREALKAKRALMRSLSSSPNSSTEFNDANIKDYGNWLVRLDTNRNTTNVFFLFPAAGSSISMFGNWSKFMESSALFGVSYPGHLVRLEETPIDDLKSLVKAISKEIMANIKNGNISKDQSIYCFGHSLGALVSYEVVMNLQNERKNGNPDAPTFTGIIVSASPSPIYPRPVPLRQVNGKPIHFTDLTPEQYPEELAILGGANKESLQSKQFQKLIPSIAADFKITDGYKRISDKDNQLECAIYDIGGIDDPMVNVDSRKKWDLENAEGYPLVRINFEGSHWFIQEHTEDVLKRLKSELKL